MSFTNDELIKQLAEARAERDQMRDEKDNLKELNAALVDKPAAVERNQMGCQPQKLPPLPQFDGKDPKKYHALKGEPVRC